VKLTLSRGEAYVLEQLAAGLPPKKIAAMRGVDPQTVRTSMFRAKAKLGARTTFQAVAMYAVRKVKEEI